jgi:uncharacterized delta-60 repeat protein
MFTTGFALWNKMAAQITSEVLEFFGAPYYVGGVLLAYKPTVVNRLVQTNTDGTIDTSFDIGTGFSSTVFSTAIQSDGKILVGGSFTSYKGTTSNYIARLNTDGTRDTSFAAGTGFSTTVLSIAIQSDGKILAGGNFTTYQGFSVNRIVRLNTDGTRDTSFSVGTGFSSTVNSILIQPDGKILVGGNFTSYQSVSANRVIRLNTDGTRDTSFVIGTGFDSSAQTIAYSAITDKILVGGVFTSYQSVSANRIIMLNTDGTRDTSFAIGTGFSATVNKIAIQPDGKILAGGNYTQYQGATINYIVRLNTNGSRDTSFSVSTGFDASVNTIEIQTDGKILVGGAFSEYQSVSANCIIRLNTDGTRDTSNIFGSGFGSSVSSILVRSNGKILLGGEFTAYQGTSTQRITKLSSDANIDTSFIVDAGFNSTVNAIAIQPDGKIIAVGNFTTYRGVSVNRIVRLNTDGTRDTSFSVGTGFSSVTRSIAIQSDGKILVGGTYSTYQSVSANFIVRINTDGTRDTSFAIGTGFNSTVSAVSIQPDGKILAGGDFTTYQSVSVNRIARLNTDGTRDTSFSVGTGFNGSALVIAVQFNGTILVGGGFTTYDGVSANRIIGLNTNGTRDTSFDIGAGFSSNIVAIAIQPDGKILCGGGFGTYQGFSSPYIIRLNMDGSRDTSFVVSTGFNNVTLSILIQTDGKILIGGSFTTYRGVSAERIIRLNADGSRDTSFAIGTGFSGTVNSILPSKNSINVLPATYSLTVGVSSINEGGSTTYQVNTTNILNRRLYWSIDGDVASSDFVNFAGSVDVFENYGQIGVTLVNDLTTEGPESFTVRLRTGNIAGPIVASATPVTINDTSQTPVAPSFVTSTNKLPIFGTGGAATHPPSGWTSLQNSSADDAFRTFNTSFNFTINNTNYTAHNIGSNTYITWGNGSTAYSGLSASNPAINKLFLGAADNSFQRVSSLQLSNYSRVRYEGNAATSGTVGSPGIVLEVTIFNPANYGGQQVIEVLVGNHGRTAGQAGIANTSTYYSTWSMAVNTSFVLVGNSTGTEWVRWLGHVNNSGY